MIIKQYIPTFVDTDDPEQEEIVTLDELLALPFVSRWANYPNFHRFSLSYDPDDIPDMLMCELDGGTTWYCVAWVKLAAGETLDIPRFEPNKTLSERTG